jgi:PAS domain S-box-containing protein
MERIDFRPIDRSQHEVLVVDDNPASRYATVRLLRAAGFRVREAASGGEALAMADEGVSAAVLDVHLPDIDGFELSQRLRSRPQTARVPVLHLSAAFVTDEDKVRGLDAGADAYLTHPVEPAVIVASVQALVRTRVAEDAMRRSEAKFRTIYAQAPAGIGLLNEQGRFIDANPALLLLLARHADEVVGHRLTDFLPAPWNERSAPGLPVAEVLSRHPDVPLIDAAGKPVAVQWTVSAHIEPGVSMVVVTDISQRVHLENQRRSLLDAEREARGTAERINRMKDDFIAVLSHELRAPLNAIMGWTHILKLRGGNEETMRGLAAIERNGNMQARMIADILDMSRLNLGKLPLELGLFDAHEVIHAAVEAMRPSIREQEQRLVLDLGPVSRHIRADSSRVQQIVWNLLSNAVKFSPRGGEIRVTLREEGAGVRLTVVDQGQGIDPQFLPFLFERFTQGDAAGSRYRSGLGLGLSIVKQLTEAHGGRVTASSAGLGQGATMGVWLPFEPRETPATLDQANLMTSTLDTDETGRSLEGLRLLVVDDDPESCAMLQLILGERGASVSAAQDYESALKIFEELGPDVLISDIGMPGRTGYELVREVRQRQRGDRPTPTIALTSFTRTQDLVQARDAGFDAHCAKPLQPLQLVQTIRRLVDEGPG